MGGVHHYPRGRCDAPRGPDRWNSREWDCSENRTGPAGSTGKPRIDPLSGPVHGENRLAEDRSKNR
ncbi:hypothetical protein PIB30_050594 [Stylosanthes scabra]|uniref:Uncharacterized protein n=1 Tax=Stylosanthes scabra TaxID=79078 RepID=A0ABU6VGT4_9FABA|nr:hypothetical protein [Stylosanthes scabra]